MYYYTNHQYLTVYRITWFLSLYSSKQMKWCSYWVL